MLLIWKEVESLESEVHELFSGYFKIIPDFSIGVVTPNNSGKFKNKAE